MIDCTCINNPNCFKCDGTGIIRHSKKRSKKGFHNKTVLAKHHKESFQLPSRQYIQVIDRMEDFKTNQKQLASDLLACPYCKSRIKQQRLSKHKMVCPKNPYRATTHTNPRNSHKSLQESSKKHSPLTYSNKKYGIYSSSYCAEYNLDMSRGFHVRRESGRFGSYPSSDDYGEESFL